MSQVPPASNAHAAAHRATSDEAIATPQHFASDNYAGICPEALHYLIEANASGHEVAYGDDRWTQRVCDGIRQLFDRHSFLTRLCWYSPEEASQMNC